MHFYIVHAIDIYISEREKCLATKAKLPHKTPEAPTKRNKFHTFPSRSALNLSAWRPLFLSRRDILRFVSLFLDMALHSCSHSLHATLTSGGGGGMLPPVLFPPPPPPPPAAAAASAASATASAHPPCLVRPSVVDPGGVESARNNRPFQHHRA